eukprot:Amastigsp_a513256_13.p4 type:complete len:149 gc:universal Amastigsp_a513256_13:169-615(+)
MRSSALRSLWWPCALSAGLSRTRTTPRSRWGYCESACAQAACALRIPCATRSTQTTSASTRPARQRLCSLSLHSSRRSASSLSGSRSRGSAAAVSACGARGARCFSSSPRGSRRRFRLRRSLRTLRFCTATRRTRTCMAAALRSRGSI